MARISIEQWKGKRVVVARQDNGKIISWSRRQLSLDSAKRIFKQQKTFVENETISTQQLENLTEISVTRKVPIIKSKKFVKIGKVGIPRIQTRDRRAAQYVVTFLLKNGKEVTARSNRLGTPLARTPAKAREQAYDNAFALLTVEVFGFSDSNEGMRAVNEQVINIKEGWVYYRPR